MSEEDKALVVLTQEEIDDAIHGIEMAGQGMWESEFRQKFGSVYQKLHAIDQADSDSYRVK